MCLPKCSISGAPAPWAQLPEEFYWGSAVALLAWPPQLPNDKRGGIGQDQKRPAINPNVRQLHLLAMDERALLIHGPCPEKGEDDCWNYVRKWRPRTWEGKGELGFPLSEGHTCTWLPGNQLLLLGGVDQNYKDIPYARILNGDLLCSLFHNADADDKDSDPFQSEANEFEEASSG